MKQRSDLIENFFPWTIFICILPNSSLPFSTKPETEEVLKGVDEKQNVTMLAMQHSKRSHICSSLFLVAHCTCPADGSSALPQPRWHQQPSVGHKSTNTAVRDLGSAAQEPRLCLPWGTACCFSVQPTYSGLISICQRRPLHYLGKTLEMSQ